MFWNIKWDNINEKKPNLNEECLVLIFSMDVEDPNQYSNHEIDIAYWTEHSEFITADYQEVCAKYYIPLPLLNQPERSKRENLECDNCKIPHIFNCCWDQSKYKHKNNEECDYYKHKMRCSEHCGNTVREVQ